MNNPRIALRELVIYAVGISLALFLGYLLATPYDTAGLTLIGGVLLLLCSPLAIRYHYPFMLLAWSLPATLSFLPGRPSLYIVAIALSFAVSFTHRIVDKNVRHLWVPELSRPLICLAVVVLVTMQLRGGLGLRIFGSGSVGGKNYIAVLAGILGYFALTVRKIPPNRAVLYLGLFMLGGTAAALSDLRGRLPEFIFLFVPPQPKAVEVSGETLGRLAGLCSASGAVFSYMLARYGISGMLAPGHRHRFLLLCGLCLLSLFGGFRSALIGLGLVFTIQFWLEGLFRTSWVWVFLLVGILVGAVALPFASRLPLNIQRTLSFLPIEVDPLASMDATGSSEWRLEMWRAAVPMVPKYLLLGKGYTISAEDYGFMTDRSFGTVGVEENGSFVAGDFHSGPLSVLIPFGLWGALAFLWLCVEGGRVLWRNWRYGDPALRTVNTFLLASYIGGVFSFLVIFGALNAQMVSFAGALGMSVALNGGVARPAPMLPKLPGKLPKPSLSANLG